MSSLIDHADRLTRLAQSIRSSAAVLGRTDETTQSVAGPFTRAILEIPLGDLIRDIDPSETGLFTLVSQGPVSNQNHAREDTAATQKAEITRVALPIATPLRRPPSGMQRRDGGQRAMEHDPEIYANATLKYLDRYQSIRPMPRFVEKAEALIHQISAVRERTLALEEKLKHLSTPVPPGEMVSPEAIIKQEESRIADAQARIAALKQQKEALLSKNKTGSRVGLKATMRPRPTPSGPITATASPDAQEEDFWNTPGAPARTLQFTGDLLTDEQLDLGDPDSSLTSPFPTARWSRAMHFTHREAVAEEGQSKSSADDSRHPPEITAMEPDEEDERTVILSKEPDDSVPLDVVEGPQSNAGVIVQHNEPADRSAKTSVKITTELERIVSKIWATIADSIMPGHTFDLSGASSNKPPRAKETIAYLRKLSAQSPSPDSPSASSVSSVSLGKGEIGQPTAQQILTARILLTLLTSPPNHSLPLNALRDALSKSESGILSGTVTRPIYACVAKRLLKIERGGGEQVVKFDV